MNIKIRNTLAEIMAAFNSNDLGCGSKLNAAANNEYSFSYSSACSRNWNIITC